MIPGKTYTPEVLLRIAWRRKWRIVLPTLAVACAVVTVTYRLPNLYKSDTLILVVPQRVPESYVRSTVTTRIEDRLQAISQQILSRTRLERVIQDFNLYSDLRRTDIMEDIVERMRNTYIGVEIVKGDAFRVSFTSDDPRTAMKVTERLASLFIDESLRDREVLAEGTNTFLEGQLEDARRRLIENEKLLEGYRRKHDGQMPTQLEANVQGLHNTEMQLQSLVESLSRDRDRHLLLERIIADSDIPEPVAVPPPPASAPPPAGAEGLAGGTAADQLKSASAQLRTLALRLKPDHPDLARMKRIVAELQARADLEALQQPVSPISVEAPLTPTPTETARRSRLGEAKAEVENLDRQIVIKQADETRLREVLTRYQKRIESVPTREAELVELMRDYDTMQQTYKTLLAKKQESQISANLERRQIGEQFKILDPARLPEKPFSPDRPRLYAMGIAGALAVGLGLAALAEYFDRAMRSEEDVRAALNLLVLATVPLMPTVRPRKRNYAAIAISLSVGAAVLATAVIAAWRLLR